MRGAATEAKFRATWVLSESIARSSELPQAAAGQLWEGEWGSRKDLAILG